MFLQNDINTDSLMSTYSGISESTDDGIIETDRDVLDWLKYAQSETTGIS